MKKILLGSLVLLTFSASIILFNISCNKESDAQPNSNSSNCIGPQPKFQFKANGKLYVCDAVFDKRIGWSGNFNDLNEGGVPCLRGSTRFELSGGLYSPTSGESTYINLFLSNTNPTVGTYNENNIGSDCNFDFDNYIYTSSTHTITFTRVSNETADGTFSGVVKTVSFGGQPNPNMTVTITDGVFSNIPIFKF
jgi:hypothetical protein